MKRAALPLLLVAASISAVLLAPAATAEQTEDESIAENITRMKAGIIETIATWVPFVVLFTLLGVAMAAIGLNLYGRRER
ncbi:MAG TPA: hypothetical protein VFH78_15615 [Candidatus Thermoplasmatota archaeon]|nr:hypothetical protein [Candidatus Thermoplasmatota archaeon]